LLSCKNIVKPLKKGFFCLFAFQQFSGNWALKEPCFLWDVQSLPGKFLILAGFSKKVRSCGNFFFALQEFSHND